MDRIKESLSIRICCSVILQYLSREVIQEVVWSGSTVIVKFIPNRYLKTKPATPNNDQEVVGAEDHR